MQHVNWAVVLGLVACLAAGGPVYADDAALKAAARNFLRALYVQHDRADVEKWLVAPTDAPFLLSHFPVPDRPKAEIASAIQGASFASPIVYRVAGTDSDSDKNLPVGATTLLQASMAGGEVQLLPMQLTGQGWKFDPRFLVATVTKHTSSDPETVARRFLLAVFQKDLRTVGSLVTSNAPADIDMVMQANEFPSGDMDQILELADEMTVARAHKGETLKLPDGQTLLGVDEPDHVVLVGLYGIEPMTFDMHKVDGAWKVVPQPYVLWLRRRGDI